MSILSERIKDRRQKLNLNQEELADLVGISRNVLSSYESGRNVPPGNTLVPLADALKSSVDYLLGRSDDPHQIFTDKEEMTPDQKHVIFRVTELIKEDMSSEDLESAVEFLEFLQSRNAKNKNK